MGQNSLHCSSASWSPDGSCWLHSSADREGERCSKPECRQVWCMLWQSPLLNGIEWGRYLHAVPLVPFLWYLWKETQFFFFLIRSKASFIFIGKWKQHKAWRDKHFHKRKKDQYNKVQLFNKCKWNYTEIDRNFWVYFSLIYFTFFS